MTPRIIFDGANIAFPQGAPGDPDLDRYATVVLGVCDRLGVDPSTEVVTVFDAGFQHRFNARQRQELRRLQELWGHDRVTTSPPGEAADAWILDLAHITNAIVVSGDLYRDHPNRKGAVLVPPMLASGIVLLRKGYLLAEQARDDIEVELETIFPAYEAKRLAAPAPRPEPTAELRASTSEAARSLQRAALTVFEQSGSQELELSLLVKKMREHMGSDAFDRACAEVAPGERTGRALRALRTLPGLAISGSPSTLWMVRPVNGQAVVQSKPPPEPAAPPPIEGARQPTMSASLQQDFVRTLYSILASSEGNRMVVARLASELASAYPGEQFARICEGIAPGSANRRFLRVLQSLHELELYRAENGEWMVMLR